jgi:methylated-DNA-protein-cysteine methyltransferase-like protein
VGGNQSFFDRVYAVVRLIPCGKVATYGQIAGYLGHPRGARTVGWALNALQSGTDVPWQRVINSKGRISLAGTGSGASLQRKLLEKEGVVFGPDGRVDLSIHAWGGPDWMEWASLVDGATDGAS